MGLLEGKVAIVVIPSSPRTYQFDPSRPESRLARAVVDDALQRADGRRDPTPTVDRTATVRGARYIDYLVPGLVGVSLMQSCMWGIGFVLVEMRTRKLIKRLVATPMRRSDFLLGFVLMRALFLCLELPMLLGFAYLAFDVRIQGSVVLFVALSALGALVFCYLSYAWFRATRPGFADVL